VGGSPEYAVSSASVGIAEEYIVVIRKTRLSGEAEALVAMVLVLNIFLDLPLNS